MSEDPDVQAEQAEWEDRQREIMDIVKENMVYAADSIGLDKATDLLRQVRDDHLQNQGYGSGRADQFEENKELLCWAYRKLMPYSFVKQEDALMMDRIKLLVEYELF